MELGMIGLGGMGTNMVRRLRRAAQQVACFATPYHHELSPVERLLPIPQRYEAQRLRHLPRLDRF